MTKDEAQSALDLIQEFKRRWMALPPFADRITRAVREGMTVAHMPIMQLEQRLLGTLPLGVSDEADIGREATAEDAAAELQPRPLLHAQAPSAEPKPSAKNVMMSAHALCPTDMSHQKRMAWIADYFLRHYTHGVQATLDPQEKRDA